jgi:RecA/RadA recombinase
MAKNKPDKDAQKEAESMNPLDLLRKEIEKKWGKNVMNSASSIMDEPQIVIPVGPMLDAALSGGIPEGSWASITGPPKCGKTTTLLSFAATAQRPEYGNRVVHYFNIEKRLKRKNLGGIKGLDISPNKFVIYESSPDLILSGEDFLEMAIHVLKTDPGAIVILDSVSALVESVVLDEGLGTQTRGGGAKLMSQFIDIVASVVPVRKSIVLGVTHQIADTSGRTQGTREKTSNRWIYQADVRLKATWGESWCVGGTKNKDTGKVEGGQEIGKIVHWICQESALGPPGIKCESYIRYGVGVDKLYEVYEMAKATGLITVSERGGWNDLVFLVGRNDLVEEGKSLKVQGPEKVYKLLETHPEWVKLLESQITSFLQGSTPES